MKLWQRMLVILVVIILVSLLAGLLWSKLFNVGFPSYISGVIGGLVAVPVWELLKRIGPKPQN